jgi:hypothetical protein
VLPGTFDPDEEGDVDASAPAAIVLLGDGVEVITVLLGALAVVEVVAIFDEVVDVVGPGNPNPPFPVGGVEVDACPWPRVSVTVLLVVISAPLMAFSIFNYRWSLQKHCMRASTGFENNERCYGRSG